ncbi:MAG: hypothetical protein BWK79_13315 [Beggiatoa sp. IS2]|nr:MAG: hypothetical protein BWK79_13315 [Beggiatoa sp. IS2]
MHSLLQRQLRRAGFDYDSLPTDLIAWQEFLARVERSYQNADYEREQLTLILGKNSQMTEFLTATAPLELPTIIAAMSDGLCAFDSQGQLLFINPSAQNYLGTEYHELDQNAVLKAFELHEKVNPDVPLKTSVLLERLSDGRAFHDSNALLKHDNLVLPVHFEYNPIIQNNQIVGSVMLFSDISDIKNVEAELIAAKEAAEKASRAKSQFLSSMSHELRTPMNAILGYSELLKEDLTTPLANMDEDYIVDLQHYVGNILQAGWHLLDLINKVLDLSRIEAGKLEVTIEAVELIDLIKDCISFILPLAEKHAITVCNETASLSPRFVLADRARLKQVLLNLLSNAVKYNNEAGTITLRLAQSSLPNYLRLQVIDTGKGLTPSQKTEIFEPFTRFSGKNVIEGTGIGLTITQRLLEIMDGKIGVDSEIDVGSTFWIEIPTGVTSDNLEATPGHRKYLLLYVEDSRTNVSLVAQILKARPDIALMSAHTGEMGLELAHMHLPDVILLDINLPGMDGFEVLRRLQESEQTNKIPVLALSAMDSSRDQERGREQGFLSYIVKPLDIKQFLAAVDQALEKSPRKFEKIVNRVVQK